MGKWTDLAELASSQHLVVDITQATALGIPPRTVADQLERRGWTRIHQGVYALPGARVTFALRAHAALLCAGERSALSGATAAYMLGLMRRRPGRIEVMTPIDRRVRGREDLTVRRSGTLRRCDVLVVDDLRVTTAARTICDSACQLSPVRLADLVVMALQLRLISVEAIHAQLERQGRIGGKRKLRGILAGLPDDETDSGFERRARAWLRRHGFRPDAEQELLVDGGRVVGKVDISFYAEHVGIACDGRWTHLLPSQQRIDRVKDNAALAAGWLLLHLLEDEFDAGGHDFLQHLARVLQQRRVERHGQ